MILPPIQSIAIAFAAGVALSAAPAWYLTAEYKDAKYTAIIEKQRSESAKILQTETEKVIVAERKASKFKDELEIQNAKSIEQVNAILADNRKLVAKLGGLRDPGTRPACGNPMPPTANPPGGDPTSAPGSEFPDSAEGFLSAEASEFLIEFSADADRAAIYAQTCHKFAVGLPNLIKE